MRPHENRRGEPRNRMGGNRYIPFTMSHNSDHIEIILAMDGAEYLPVRCAIEDAQFDISILCIAASAKA